MKITIVGVDDDIIDKVRQEGHEVSVIEGFGTEALREGGVGESDAVVVGEGHPTQVIVARDLNPDARIVVVADDVPEFVRGNADLILSEELADSLVDALETEGT
jgi:hypothetical protein